MNSFSRGYWRWLLAVSLGTIAGLWFAQIAGEAQPEGAMGYAVPPAVHMTGHVQEPDTLVVSGRVERIENYDPAGLEYFLLHMGGNNGSVSVMGSPVVPLIAYLLKQPKDARVSIELRARE